MRRGFTFVEVLTVVALLFILLTAMIGSATRARRRARLSKAQSEMASIVAEVGSAAKPEEAAARYASGEVRDPWGNRYRVEVKRTRINHEADESSGTLSVWYPNAFAPRRLGQ